MINATDLPKPQAQKERTKMMNKLPKKCRPIKVCETDCYDIEVLAIVNVVSVDVKWVSTGKRRKEYFLSNSDLGKPGNEPWFLVSVEDELSNSEGHYEDWPTFLITDRSVYYAVLECWNKTSWGREYGFTPLDVLPEVHFDDTRSLSLLVCSNTDTTMIPSVRTAVIQAIECYANNLNVD